VERLWKENGRYLISSGDTLLSAEHVVIAMATYQTPRVPKYAYELAPDIVQMHSREYRNPDQMRAGSVLVVGAGNSGAEIAIDLARAGHDVWLSGRDVGYIPVRIDSTLALRIVQPFLFRVVFHRVLTVDTPIGRKARPAIISHGAPLIRQRPQELDDAGIERVARVAGARDGKPLLEDGRTLDVANVVWCTGFVPGLSWVQLPIFDATGDPIHDRGFVRGERISFVGQHFLYAMSSTMIHGVARDAERVANAIPLPRPVSAPSLTMGRTGESAVIRN
jgi:putative flavoprotein involved in K+ transport